MTQQEASRLYDQLYCAAFVGPRFPNDGRFDVRIREERGLYATKRGYIEALHAADCAREAGYTVTKIKFVGRDRPWDREG